MKAAYLFALATGVILLTRPLIGFGGETVSVKILEGIPDKRVWNLAKAKVTEKYTEQAFAFVTLPVRYSAKAHALDRKLPFVVRAEQEIRLPIGKHRLLLRSRNPARLFVDGKLVLQHGFPKVTQNAHNPFKAEPPPVEKGLPPLTPGQREYVKTIQLDGQPHAFRLEIIVGSRKTRPEIGSSVVAVAKEKGTFRLLSADSNVVFHADDWQQYSAAGRKLHKERNAQSRLRVSVKEREYWKRRHDIARQIVKKQTVPNPLAVTAKTLVFNDIDRYIGAVLAKRGIKPNALTSDMAFLRRVTLDTVGVVPSRQSILAFMRDTEPGKRSRVIERLVNDPRWADHWVSFWQDLLAENPGLIKPTLNNTGPFRFWLYEALSDNLPMDRFVTELIMMEGSVKHGAPAAFGLATKNDVPMAAKAHVLGKTFLAVDMSCARCHDAPYHPYLQKQLFGMAAMLKRTTLKVPSTSTVKFAKGERKPRVKVTLPAGAKVEPQWHFAKLAAADLPMGILRNPKDSRERLAAVVTSPTNRRFAKVLVNRLWQRYMGVGLVQDMDDWSETQASHSELLDYLAHELVSHNYDLKHVVKVILNSHAYQRQAQAKEKLAENKLYAGPARRRMSAEQLVDSLYAAVGKEFDSEELTFDPEAWQKGANCPNLGKPRRAWQFVSLSNERDRPALALPIAQGYVDLLTAFGWRMSRPEVLTVRDDSLTPLQVMTLANGQLMHRLVRLTDDAEITSLCLENQKLPQLVEKVYQRILSRSPAKKEAELAVELLKEGYEKRRTGKPALSPPVRPRPASWSCHLLPEATRVQIRAEKAAREGDPPTQQLTTEWRTRMEDLVWSLLNSPEFVFVP